VTQELITLNVANLVIFNLKNGENFPSKAQNFHFLISFGRVAKFHHKK
jgi:hypothetical protein